MQATYPQHLDGKGSFDAAASMRRIGGPIMMDKQRQEAHLRILVDHSAVEVFTGAGEALTTRFEQAAVMSFLFCAFCGRMSVRHYWQETLLSFVLEELARKVHSDLSSTPGSGAVQGLQR